MGKRGGSSSKSLTTTSKSRGKTMTLLRETYEKVANLVGANVDESTISYKKLDKDYFIL